MSPYEISRPSGSVELNREIMGDAMFALTLDGVDDAMLELTRKKR